MRLQKVFKELYLSLKEEVFTILVYQKTPSRHVLRKRCSKNMQQICNFIEITLQHGCSTVNLLHIFRTPFHENISGGLLLSFEKPVLSPDSHNILTSYQCFKLLITIEILKLMTFKTNCSYIQYRNRSVFLFC